MANKILKINIADVIGQGYRSFWQSKHRYRVVKGGRGSKKSTTAALWHIYNMMKYPLANTLVVRKTFNTHKDSTFAQLRWATHQLGVSDQWYFTTSPLEATYLPTKQKILFRGYDDPLKLTSITVETGVLCWAWIEESFQIDAEADFNILDESIRGEMPEGLWTSITLTLNPWVASHWIKKRFFDQVDESIFTLTTNHKCNEWLDDEDHERYEALQYTDPDRYKVVALGEWGIPGGTFFDEFRSDIHITKPFPLPEDWKRYRVFDYGLDMLACYWAAMSPQGICYIYKELYESNLIISEAAKKILSLTTPEEQIKVTYAPPDMWNRRQETGKSAADLYQENGVRLTRADNNRIQGWLSMKEWLNPYTTRDEQTGEDIITANLKIFSNCINLIRCLPQVQADPRDPNDVATEPHELSHSNDAIRYLTIMHPRPARIPNKDDSEYKRKRRQNSQHFNFIKF